MTHGRRFGLLAIAGLFAAGATFSTAQAQEGPNTGAISLSASLDWTNEYWFRGIPQEDQGLILQPGLDVGVALWSNDEYSVDAYIGTWNSIHLENPTGTKPTAANPNRDQDAWYEADWYAGFSFGLPMNLWLDVSYVTLYGPNSGGNFAEEIDVAFGLDDADLWGDTGIPGWTGLQPYALFAFETDAGSDNATALATTDGGNSGTYLELGISPGFTLIDSEDYPIDLSIPIVLGLGLADYYEYVDATAGTDEDDAFGFVQVGAVASMPLSAVPAEYGSWSVWAGVHVIILNEDYIENAINPGFSSGYDEVRIVGNVGIGMEY